MMGASSRSRPDRSYGPWRVRLDEYEVGILERDTLTEPARDAQGRRALVAWVPWPKDAAPAGSHGLDDLRVELATLWGRRQELAHPNLLEWVGFGEREGPWLSMAHPHSLALRRLWKQAGRARGIVRYELREYERDKAAFHRDAGGQEIVGAEHLAVEIAEPPIAPRFALRIIAEAARGLAHLHRRGVGHGALSLDRIWVSDDGAVAVSHLGTSIGERGRARLGLLNAKTGAARYAYAAPEQLRAPGPSSPAADVYVLGILLYELLTFSHLFRGDGLFDLVQQVSRSEIPPPSRVNAALDPEWDSLLLQVLSTDPAARPEAAALATALLGLGARAGLICGAEDLSRLVHIARRSPATESGRIAFW